MRRLVLMRHAKSDYPVGVGDHDRPLSPRGERDAAAAGAWLAANASDASLVLVSDAHRTRQTWEQVSTAWASFGKAPVAKYVPRLYHGSAGTILDVVQEAAADESAVLVIAHNPGMHDLVLQLPSCASSDFRTKFPTSAIAIIEAPGWARLLEGTVAVAAIPRG